MDVKNPVEKGGAGTGDRKRVKEKKKGTKAHKFYKHRVIAFTFLAVLAPIFGFGFWALAYTKQFEKHSNTGMIPVLLVINYISMVICCIFWLIAAVVTFLFFWGILSL